MRTSQEIIKPNFLNIYTNIRSVVYHQAHQLFLYSVEYDVLEYHTFYIYALEAIVFF